MIKKIELERGWLKATFREGEVWMPGDCLYLYGRFDIKRGQRGRPLWAAPKKREKIFVPAKHLKFIEEYCPEGSYLHSLPERGCPYELIGSYERELRQMAGPTERYLAKSFRKWAVKNAFHSFKIEIEREGKIKQIWARRYWSGKFWAEGRYRKLKQCRDGMCYFNEGRTVIMPLDLSRLRIPLPQTGRKPPQSPWDCRPR